MESKVTQIERKSVVSLIDALPPVFVAGTSIAVGYFVNPWYALSTVIAGGTMMGFGYFYSYISKKSTKLIDEKTEQLGQRLESAVAQVEKKIETTTATVASTIERKIEQKIESKTTEVADRGFGMIRHIAFYAGIIGFVFWLVTKIWKRVYKVWKSDKPEVIKEAETTLDKYWDVICCLLSLTLIGAGKWRECAKMLGQFRGWWMTSKSVVNGCKTICNTFEARGDSLNTVERIAQDIEPPHLSVCEYSTKTEKDVNGETIHSTFFCNNPSVGGARYCPEHVSRMGKSMCTWIDCSKIVPAGTNRCSLHQVKDPHRSKYVCSASTCLAEVDVEYDFCVPCQKRMNNYSASWDNEEKKVGKAKELLNLVKEKETAVNKDKVENGSFEVVQPTPKGDSESDDEDSTFSTNHGAEKHSFAGMIASAYSRDHIPVEVFDLIDWLRAQIKASGTVVECPNFDCNETFKCPLYFAAHIKNVHFKGKTLNDFMSDVQNPASRWDTKHTDLQNLCYQLTVVAQFYVPMKGSKIWRSYSMACLGEATPVVPPVEQPGSYTLPPETVKIYQRAKFYINATSGVFILCALLTVAWWLYRLRKKWKNDHAVQMRIVDGVTQIYDPEARKWQNYPQDDPRRWAGQDGSLDTQIPLSKKQIQAALLKDPNFGMGSYIKGTGYGGAYQDSLEVGTPFCLHFAFWGCCNIEKCKLPHVKGVPSDIVLLLKDITVSCQYGNQCHLNRDKLPKGAIRCPFGHKTVMSTLAEPFKPKMQKKAVVKSKNEDSGDKTKSDLEKKSDAKKKGVCHQFTQKGKCSRKSCPYLHVKSSDDAKKAESKVDPKEVGSEVSDGKTTEEVQEWFWSKKKEPPPKREPPISVDLGLQGLRVSVKPTLGFETTEAKYTPVPEVATTNLPVDMSLVEFWSQSVWPCGWSPDDAVPEMKFNAFICADGIVSISHNWHSERNGEWFIQIDAIRDEKTKLLYPKKCKIDGGLDLRMYARFKGLDAKVIGEHSMGVAIVWPLPDLLKNWPKLGGMSTGEWASGKSYYILAKVPMHIANPGKTRYDKVEGFDYPTGDACSVKGNCGGPWIDANGKLLGVHIGGWSELAFNTLLRKNCRLGLS